MPKDFIVDKEGVNTVRNPDGVLIAIVCRDPYSKKHLVYFTEEASSDEIVEKLIRTDFSLKLKGK